MLGTIPPFVDNRQLSRPSWNLSGDGELALLTTFAAVTGSKQSIMAHFKGRMPATYVDAQRQAWSRGRQATQALNAACSAEVKHEVTPQTGAGAHAALSSQSQCQRLLRLPSSGMTSTRRLQQIQSRDHMVLQLFVAAVICPKDPCKGGLSMTGHAQLPKFHE